VRVAHVAGESRLAVTGTIFLPSGNTYMIGCAPTPLFVVVSALPRWPPYCSRAGRASIREVDVRRWAIGFVAVSLAVAMGPQAQVSTRIVPQPSATIWAPGVRGIPARITACASIDAATYGNGQSEASAGIQAAINACPEGQVVQLSAGAFRLDDHVLINKAITLRGAGPRQTTLQKTNGASEQEGLIIVGPSRWPYIDETTAVNLAADAIQGAMSVTVQNAAGFAPGQFVKLDEDDYATAQWMALPPRMDGSAPRVLARRTASSGRFTVPPIPAISRCLLV
jgi:hypothetical protein